MDEAAWWCIMLCWGCQQVKSWTINQSYTISQHHVFRKDMSLNVAVPSFVRRLHFWAPLSSLCSWRIRFVLWSSCRSLRERVWMLKYWLWTCVRLKKYIYKNKKKNIYCCGVWVRLGLEWIRQGRHKNAPLGTRSGFSCQRDTDTCMMYRMSLDQTNTSQRTRWFCHPSSMFNTETGLCCTH